jgi:tetratricopeptide (TPR) repeat protein
MFWKRKGKAISDEADPVPDQSPPVEEAGDEGAPATGHRPRKWLWALTAALAAVLMVVFVLVLGVIGFYDGLRDRAIANRQLAEEHYALGLEHLEASDYELAIAEFELAMRHDSGLRDVRDRLREAKDLARAQVMPTSETRRDAAALLYRQAVPHYESGNLAQAVATLEELRGLDADYQRENVETMLVKAHYQLGLNAVQGDSLDDATKHFEAVLALKPEDEQAEDQLKWLNLYAAALTNWDQDRSAAIQALETLYALAPDYKDVQTRLHNAHSFRAQEYADEGDWCGAATEYAAAVEIFPLEAMVDRRDDASLRCQATAEAPTPMPTRQATATPIPGSVPTPTATPAPTEPADASGPVLAAGQGMIAFTSYDAVRQKYEIYSVDLARGDAQLLRENASQPAFATRGRRLAFRNRDPSHLGLGILDLSTNQVRELTAHAEDTALAWSSDALHIVFASNKHGDRKWRIYDISPGEVRGEGEEWAFGQMPTWSPDRSRVAYHGCDERGDNCGVRVMNAGGFDPGRLTTDPSDTAPSWSPDGASDGQQVAFISARDGNWELYLVDVATGQERRLTNHPAADVAPTWSPDGRRVAFLSNRDGAWALYILELQSGQAQKVIATGDAYPDPVGEQISWLP